MTSTIAILLFLIFVSTSLIHFYWAFGGKWGINVVIPTKNDEKTKVIKPNIFASLIVALGLLKAGFIVLLLSHIVALETPLWLNKFGLKIIIIIFAIRAIGDFNYVGLFKKTKQTRFGLNDTRYFTPLCMLITSLTIILDNLI